MITPCRNRACVTGVCLLLAAVLIVPVPLAPAPTHSDIELREDEFLLAYAEGNYRLCHKKLEQMIVENPAHPVSVLYYPYLFQLADIFGPAAVDETAEKIREALDRSGEEKAKTALLRLRCVIEKLRYRLDREKAKQATDALKPVRRWTLFGPYHRFGPGDIEQKFEPEIVTGGTPIISQRNAIVTNYDGWLDPGRYLYPARGIVYARISFYTEGTAKIHVYSDSVYRVFINGRSAIKNTPEDRRSARVIRITRAAGVTVLVKLWGDPVHKIRMLITSDDDRNINPIREDDKIFSGECGIEEEPEYPGSIVMAESGPRGYLHRGIYFDGLGSREAEYWYRTSINRFRGGHVPFLLASALLSGDNAHPGTFRYEEARCLLERIHSDYPSYVPARHSRLKLLIEREENKKAYFEGKKALSAIPLDIHSSLVFLGLLDAMGREREFREAVGLIRKEYPDSPLLLEKEACYYSKRNPAARAKVMNELLKNSFSPEQARSLIREETARGEYESALSIINSCNYNYDFTGELIDIYVKKGDYDEARSEIFKALIPGDRPDLYHYLGLIDIIQSDDPSLYFQKQLDCDPSKFEIDDYVRYIAGGNLENPFARYYDGSVVDALRNDTGPPQSHADVLYRGRIVVISRDGSSRTYCEELVRVNDETGALRWRSMRIPQHGVFQPVRVRVYGSNGIYAEDFSVSRVNDGAYITITPVRKDTILHISYIMNNRAENGGIISMGPLYLQQYDEPVKRISVTVIAPDELQLHFMMPEGIRVKEAGAGSARIYSATLNDCTPVSSRLSSAGKQAALPAISFSTMAGPEDFAAWYNGLLSTACGHLDEEAGRFAGENVEKTVGSVYQFLSTEIEHEQGGFGSPVPVGETLIRKRGSTENKAILARALLERLGIRTYIAFARSKFLPDPGIVAHQGYYTHILLYVPLDAGRALWLDFSSPGYRCGITAESVSGTDALVIVNDFHRIKKVTSAGSPLIK